LCAFLPITAFAEQGSHSDLLWVKYGYVLMNAQPDIKRQQTTSLVAASWVSAFYQTLVDVSQNSKGASI
jgi:hypothetical protein